MSRKTKARFAFVAIVLFLCIGTFNLLTLTDIKDLAGTILIMFIGLVALLGLYKDFKKNKRRNK